jgi:hypothetical protein
VDTITNAHCGRIEMVRTNESFAVEENTLTQSFAIPGTAATVLILGGIVLQLGGLGYMNALHCVWILAMIAESVWNAIAIHGNLPWLQQLVVFWPLLLVGAGLGILLVLGGEKGAAAKTRVSNAG